MRRIAALLGLMLAAATLVAALPAGAAGQPDVGFKVPAHAHAHKVTNVRWHASGVSSSESVVMQGLNGRTWETFRHLHGTSGTTTIPGQPVGIYDFRIAVYSSSGSLITATGHKLHVFGTVSWGKLFQTPTNQRGTYGSFRYVFQFFSNEVDYTALKVSGSPCDHVSIRYIPGTGNPNEQVNNPSEATVMLGRHGESTITRTTPPQTIGKLSASVPLGKSWSVNLSEPGNGGRLLTWYFNGKADCDQQRITTYQYNQN